MTDYHLRSATIDDVDVLVHHRIAMFEDMGVPVDRPTVEAAFRPWLLDTMPNGTYRAWVVESDAQVISGGGIAVLPWPPGPRSVGGRLAFVYNVYTEPDHRHRGLGRMVMEAIHAWCRQERIGSLALNASRFGQSLYESLGYSVTPNPMMVLGLE
jgi:GNAT superfamily N-acetyltransferase